MDKKHIVPIIVLVLLGIGLYTISAKRAGIISSSTADEANVSNINNLSESKNTQNMDTTNTGNSADGAVANGSAALVAKNGDVITVNYTGKLTDGKVFDSSIPRGQPFTFQLGAGMVIAGWDKGLLGTKVGDKKTLTIAPQDGYGAQGITDPRTGTVVIPPNATLIFDVEVVNIQRK
jgi:FKBP-type peptidyl-prolyl cis-trans isomerase